MKKYVILTWCLINNFYCRKFIIKSLLMPFLPVFTQKPSCGLVFKDVAVFLFSIITETWNALTAVFSSPLFPELYSTRPRNRSANVPVNTCQQYFRFIWQKNEENTKYRVFMRILNLFLDFRSDVRFRRNDSFKI